MDKKPKELIDNFLYNTNEFITQFKRVLGRTTACRASSKIEFWTHFMLGSIITIQDSKINEQLNIKDICFCVLAPPRLQTQVVKLAFKVTKKEGTQVILRSVSIGENDHIPAEAYYSNSELNDKTVGIKKHFALLQDIAIATVDTQILHINIKNKAGPSVQLKAHNAKIQTAVSSKSFVKVKPLGTNAPMGKQTLDDLLNFIANPRTVRHDDVESFFNKFVDLYNAQELLFSSETAYHGATYGMLVLNYHIKYGIDTYVEYSAGRGFLDLYILCLRDGKGNKISDAIKIIIEFKASNTDVQDAVKQIKDKGYAYQLFGRTTNNHVIMVGTNFGYNGVYQGSKVLVEGPTIIDPSKDFISTLINNRQIPEDVTEIKNALEAIFYSTRSEESLDRIILGELLSTSGTQHNMFVIKDIPNNQRAITFVFKHEGQSAIILTIIERETLTKFLYDRKIFKDTSKPATRGNVNIEETKEVDLDSEVIETILYIQKELDINSGKRIDITINPKGDVFKDGKKNYCLDIKVSNVISNAPQTQQSYISQFITKYDITSNINIDHLILELQKLNLENMASPPYDGTIDPVIKSQELDKLRHKLLNLKDFIPQEKDLKAVLHGLFLHKKFHGKDIISIAELSAGHGRVDLALVFKDVANDPTPPIVLELGLGTSNEQMQNKKMQLTRYIKDFKSITSLSAIQGIVLGFSKAATEASEIIKIESFVEKVDHTTSDEGGLSPLKSSLSRSHNVQDGDNPQSAPSGIAGIAGASNSPAHISPNSDTHQIQGIKTPERQNVNPDNNSPQPSTSGIVGVQPRKRLSSGTESKAKSLKHCLSPNRQKREASFCKINWEDVDAISISQTRHIEEIVIDQEKLLNYSKQHAEDEVKSLQLLQFAQEINNFDRTTDQKYKALFDEVIKVGGYKNYIQQNRINYLGSNVIQNDGYITPKLKLKLINSAGMIQLIRGIHGTIVSCQDGITTDCALNVGSIGYSFLSNHIERAMVKTLPKIGKTIVGVTSHIAPKILSYNTRFVTKTFVSKYGTTMAKGAARTAGGIFDIIDIGIATNTLVRCHQIKDKNTTCSKKEIRDSIADITFASSALTAGIAFTAIGPAIAVGFAIMVAQGIYGGISNIIEYEEKYNTSDAENWSIFWRTLFFQGMAEDIKHLEIRHNIVNVVAQDIWNKLQKSSDFIIAWATGLGQVVIENHNAILPSTAHINMSHIINDRNQFSRVLPKPITNATMVCLPKITNADYEKGRSQVRDDAIYECDNAMVIMDDKRRQSLDHDTKYIFFDLSYINTGRIIGSNEFNNIFYIFAGSALIYGISNLSNSFVFLNDSYSGTIALSNNSKNILDVSNLLDDIVNMQYSDFSSGVVKITIGAFQAFANDIETSLDIRYIGRHNKIDHIVCKTWRSEAASNKLLLDSGGGRDQIQPDKITNCSRAIVSPYTMVSGDTIHNATYYITSPGDHNGTSVSNITVGSGTIIFPAISLLNNCTIMKYNRLTNTLIMNIALSGGGNYELQLNNFRQDLSKNDVQNYKLIDQYGSHIVPKFNATLDETIIQNFALYNHYDIIDGSFSDDTFINYYHKISYTKHSYGIFGILHDEHNRLLKFGSIGNDVMSDEDNTVFMSGGMGSDIYITTKYSKLFINNESSDLLLDVLSVLVNIKDMSVGCNKHNLIMQNAAGNSELIIIIIDYCKGVSYQHITLMDTNKNLYIPFYSESQWKLVPFCHKSLNQNLCIISNNTAVAVIDIDLDNMVLYKQDYDLLLRENKHEAFSDLSILLKNFYNSDNEQLSHTKLYAYNDGQNNIIPLDQMDVSTITYKIDYYNIIQEHIIDLSEHNFTVIHNQKRDTNNQILKVESSNEKIGIIVLKNSRIEDLRYINNCQTKCNDLILQDSNSGNMLIIKNWYKDDIYKIAMFEFERGLELVRYMSDEIIYRLKLNNAFDHELAKNLEESKSVIRYLIFKCQQNNSIPNSNFRCSALEDECEKIQKYDNSYISEDMMNLIETNDKHGRAFMLLLGKAYNQLLLQYPDTTKQNIQDVYCPNCFNIILSHSKLTTMLEYVIKRNGSMIEKLVNDNQHDVESIIMIYMQEPGYAEHRHRHHHGSNGERVNYHDQLHHRGVRDIVHDSKMTCDDMTSSDANINKPLIHSIFKFMLSIAPFKYLFITNKMEHKTELHVDDSVIHQKINAVSASNDRLNLDKLDNLNVSNDFNTFSEQVLKTGFLSDSNTEHKAFYPDKSTLYELNHNATLLLLEWLVRKCTGVNRDSTKYIVDNNISTFWDGLSEHEKYEASEIAYSAQIPNSYKAILSGEINVSV